MSNKKSLCLEYTEFRVLFLILWHMSKYIWWKCIWLHCMCGCKYRHYIEAFESRTWQEFLMNRWENSNRAKYNQTRWRMTAAFIPNLSPSLCLSLLASNAWWSKTTVTDPQIELWCPKCRLLAYYQALHDDPSPSTKWRRVLGVEAYTEQLEMTAVLSL